MARVINEEVCGCYVFKSERLRAEQQEREEVREPDARRVRPETPRVLPVAKCGKGGGDERACYGDPRFEGGDGRVVETVVLCAMLLRQCGPEAELPCAHEGQQHCHDAEYVRSAHLIRAWQRVHCIPGPVIVCSRGFRIGSGGSAMVPQVIYRWNSVGKCAEFFSFFVISLRSGVLMQ